MAPFLLPKLAIAGLKERIESLTVQGDRLYAGTGTGNLHVYSVDENPDHDEEIATLVETKTNLTRRAIDQLGFVKDINSLVVLSESSVSLYPLPNFSPSTPLPKAKGAFSFAIHSSVQHASDVQHDDFERPKSLPMLVTYLAVGCRRKLVIYSWRDGEAQDVKEIPLPHSPRAMVFLGYQTICLAYPTEYVLYSLESSSTIEMAIPSTVTTSVTGASAFGGLSGYITLGLGFKAKPCLAKISDTEVLVAKEHVGGFFSRDGKLSKSATIDWSAPPEEIAYVKPYVLSTLPPGSLAASSGEISSQSTSIQIRSSISLSSVQSIAFPFLPTSVAGSPAHSSIRLLTLSSTAKSTLFLLTTPIDRNAAASEGSSLWHLRMRPWNEQIDELVNSGSYVDALSLLEVIEEDALPDKDKIRAHIRALNAVSLFRAAKYDDAINTFIDLEVNPAKVVALYPESVAGRLSVPQEDWIPLFGGPTKTEDTTLSTTPSQSDLSKDSDSNDGSARGTTEAQPERVTSPIGSMRGRFKTSLDAFMPSGSRDPETASISSTKRKERPKDNFHRSVETLLQYLPDRRPKIAAALAAVHITPSQSHQISPLSEASREELFALPDTPLSSLTPQQLLRFAQIVDTALFKSYLIVRPGLLGPLCRAENWCEVSEVEEVLRAREKYAELIYLYNGKKMHDKALSLLQQLSEKEEDMEDKLSPSITYLQRLGPEYLHQIFESSKWIFKQDSDMAFQIFTSEEVDLPRKPVADFLESIDPRICARYLEYLIGDKEEKDTMFHDRLAEIYLNLTLSAKGQGNEEARRSFYAKFLNFLETDYYYHVEHLFSMLPREDLFEARATLLGRLGRDQHALEIYVYRLQDYAKAEAYCKRAYQPGAQTENVFMILLRIYLRPNVQTSSDLLGPALELISRHSPRIDPVETLQLLPPLVTAQDVRAFLTEALRVSIFDSHNIREISKARNEQVARKLMLLQSNRVKVTDSRICPQCHKRLGNSVIAVHSPRGEVTHYQCREAFSRQLNEKRR